MSNKNFGKKLLAVVMATAMAATVLAGCGDAKPTTTPSNGAKESKVDANAEPVEISIYRDSFNVEVPDTAELEAISNAINEYIKDKINVKVKLTDIGNAEFGNKANLALGNGEINLLWTAQWVDVVKTDELIKQNAAYDLTDLLPGTKLFESMPQWVWDACAFNGRYYFTSCYKESAEGYSLMFRKDLVDKYGWDLSKVTCLKDIEPMLADCKDKEGLRYPFLTQHTGMFYRFYLDYFDFSMSPGNSLLGVDRATDTLVSPILSKEYKDYVTLMCEWGQKGYISEDDATKTTVETTTQTQDWGICWWTNVPNNGSASERYKQEVVMAPVTKAWSHSNSALGSCFAVTSNCTEEEAKACIDFLGLLYTDKSLADLYTYGIEGVDYDREDGKVKAKGGLYSHNAWDSCNQECVSLITSDPDNLVDLYADFNNNASGSSAGGFRFDMTPIEAEYLACTNVFDQYGFMLENGAFAPADVDAKLAEYQTALDEAGYQKVLAEAQSQYDAWKKSK